jgi:hypothetical protein
VAEREVGTVLVAERKRGGEAGAGLEPASFGKEIFFFTMVKSQQKMMNMVKESLISR